MATILKNARGTHGYELLDTYSAGMKLSGAEVKALKTHKGGSLVGSFATVYKSKVLLRNMRIPAYQIGNAPGGYNPLQTRELLVTKKERQEIETHLLGKGLTLLPIDVYSSNGRIRITIALARKQKAHDKRAALRKREDERAMRRVTRNH